MSLFGGWTLLTVFRVFVTWNSVRYPFNMSPPLAGSSVLVNYSASELKRLNCQQGFRLKPSTNLLCIELGIHHHPRYVYRGLLSSCPAPTGSPGPIPVLWPTKRHARVRSQCGANLDFLRS